MKVEYRRVQGHDLEGIYEVEKASFSTPWQFDSLLYDVCVSPVSLYVVALSESKIIGFCGVHVIMDECHINNVAVLQQFRRRGVGQGLIEFMLLHTQKTVKKYTLEVRQNNKSAINLYEKFGFSAIGYRKNYYADTHEDAIIMHKEQKT